MQNANKPSPNHSVLAFVPPLARLPTGAATTRTPTTAIINRGSVLGGGVAVSPLAGVLVEVRVEVVSAGVRLRAASDGVAH